MAQISEYTNSQSPVRPGDLRSNDRRHRQLQSAFDMLSPPVFYERRRGEWLSLTAAERQGYQAGGRVNKEDIGQRYLAFRGKPAEAITKKETIFSELENEAFDTTVSAQVYMLSYTLYQQADDLMTVSHEMKLLKLVPGFKSQTNSELNAPTQLEALRRVRKLVCSHAVALARVVLATRYSSIAEGRSAVIRARLLDANDPTAAVIWGLTFKAIRFWFSSLTDKAALKATMQRSETFTQMKAILDDVMADGDLTAKLAAISNQPT